MQLPGRLKSTTLGDLMGALHRACASGTLELVEDRGRTHRVHVSRGLVVAVELDGVAPSLAELLRRERAADDDTLRRSLLRAMTSRRLHGEILVEEFRLSPKIVAFALRRQLLLRLATIEQVADARIAFRVAVRPPRGALNELPLQPREFLFGRRRERQTTTPTGERQNLSAWSVLGVPPGTQPADIKRAYRRLARSVHPDLHPLATEEQRRELETRFAQINDAYRVLVA